MNIEDKEYRKALIERYLDAETTPDEEWRLRNFYATVDVDDNEKAIARLLDISAPSERTYSQTKADEYDRLFGGEESTEASRKDSASRMTKRRGIIFKSLFAFAACAAAVAVIMLLRPRNTSLDFTPLEIAQSISALAELNSGEIESVAAKPTGGAVIVTVVLKNGKCSDFWMARDGVTGEIQLLAVNAKH